MANPFPNCSTIKEIAQRFRSHPEWPDHIGAEACERVMLKRSLWEAFEAVREAYEDEGTQRGKRPLRYDIFLITKPDVLGAPFREAIRAVLSVMDWPTCTNIEIDDFSVLLASMFTQMNKL